MVSVPELQVCFSTAQKDFHLNDLFTSVDVKRMLEEKDYAAVDTVLNFVAAFLDHAIEVCGDNQTLTTVYKLYTDIVNHQLHTKPEREMQRDGEVVASGNSRRLKMLEANLFERLKYFHLCTLKFCMLDRIVEDAS